jgi:hypothetical protein
MVSIKAQTMAINLRYILSGTILIEQRPVRVRFESSSRHINLFADYTVYDLNTHEQYTVKGKRFVSVQVYNVSPAVV